MIDRLQNAEDRPLEVSKRTKIFLSPARIKELQKFAGILELLELMEESHKDKTWILDLIKRNHLKIRIRPFMGTVSILKN
jgi:hypothetical protein